MATTAEEIKARRAGRDAERRERKPRGMSDARWRIERRRRANSHYYRDYGEEVR